MTSRFSFKPLIGVEFANELVATARHIECFACRAEMVQANATKYELPPDNLMVCLYDPIGPEVLRLLLSSLREISTGHEDKLLYLNPINSSCVEEFAHEIYKLAGAKVDHFE